MKKPNAVSKRKRKYSVHLVPESPPDIAFQNGIRTHHSREKNGEVRFRLFKDDGTAYTRTEANDTGGWQQSHFHESIRETFIVQRGWIGYAERLPGKVSVRVYKEGQIFTTEPLAIHNVYMPAHAIIHTVKHGVSNGDDRKTDSETEDFDRIVKSYSKKDIWTLALQTEEEIYTARENETYSPGKKEASRKKEEKYTAEYRHFDILIWQLPMWCTGLLTVAMLGLNSISDNNVFIKSGFEPSYIASVFLVILGLLTLNLSHALNRFRRHQASLKPQSSEEKTFGRVTLPWFVSAQTCLQIIITLLSFIPFFAATVLLAGHSQLFFILFSLVFLFLVVWREFRLRQDQEKTLITLPGRTSSPPGPQECST